MKSTCVQGHGNSSGGRSWFKSSLEGSWEECQVIASKCCKERGVGGERLNEYTREKTVNG